ncbi:hypothetical protein [Bacillus thuringiensis]|uniref:hypothetical protein n=1 Tax=Bacillus thuringiensis TaxID=1428 RepID=UPI0005B69FBC|nr:hypothetical protein [Bacillus thuringiensis]KIP28111.1 hypothetical protein BG10_6717 [Bacillus thuringiensis serovar morrisoni]MCT6948285.1 hypothetical protein [Bacillus thuringiensis]MED2080192.1 hypothetical protein [Bacillus thuringiensis]MEE2015558.1 hypothetical protein [Bacillus thuringiensis]
MVTVKEVYMSAKEDKLMPLIVIIDLLLQHGKIKWRDDSGLLMFYMSTNKEKWNRIIINEMRKRGIAA